MAVTPEDVRKLREMTDAPMMDCKRALDECKGDMAAAVDWLRKKGIAKAAKKADREMTEGRVDSYIHTNGKVGVLLELQCETDFCARNAAFQQLSKDVCMHIAAADPAPQSVTAANVPASVLEKERSIYMEQAKQSGKPEQFWPKIVEGRMDKFIKSVSLVDQPFVKNADITIGELVAQTVGKLGENISIRRFTKFRVGE